MSDTWYEATGDTPTDELDSAITDLKLHNTGLRRRYSELRAALLSRLQTCSDEKKQLEGDVRSCREGMTQCYDKLQKSMRNKEEGGETIQRLKSELLEMRHAVSAITDRYEHAQSLLERTKRSLRLLNAARDDEQKRAAHAAHVPNKRNKRNMRKGDSDGIFEDALDKALGAIDVLDEVVDVSNNVVKEPDVNYVEPGEHHVDEPEPDNEESLGADPAFMAEFASTPTPRPTPPTPRPTPPRPMRAPTPPRPMRAPTPAPAPHVATPAAPAAPLHHLQPLDQGQHVASCNSADASCLQRAKGAAKGAVKGARDWFRRWSGYSDNNDIRGGAKTRRRKSTPRAPRSTKSKAPKSRVPRSNKSKATKSTAPRSDKSKAPKSRVPRSNKSKAPRSKAKQEKPRYRSRK